MGEDTRNSFMFKNTSSHLLIHLKVSFFFSVEKKWNILSSAQERKWDKAVGRLISCWTSLTLEGLLVPMLAWNFSGVAFVPLLINMKPRNFPAWTKYEQLLDSSTCYNYRLTLGHIPSLSWGSPFMRYSLSNHQCKTIGFPLMFWEHCFHESLISGVYVLKPKGYDVITIVAMIGHECCFWHIDEIHLNMVVFELGVD